MPAEKPYFTIFARWPGEVRLFSIEWEMIETAAEALAAVRQNARAVQVLRSDPDSPSRDVSEDIARAWLAELQDAGFHPDEAVIPAFIGEHLSRDAIAQLF